MKIKSTQDELLNFLASLWDGHYDKENGLQMYREIRRIILLYFRKNREK